MPFSSIEQLSQKDVKSGRLLQRVHGAIVHGLGRYFFLVDPDRIQKGANQGNNRHVRRSLDLSNEFSTWTQ